MSSPILATKLYIPPPRLKVVLRPRLTERLNESLHGKLTLISAPAGFGKTTVVSEWVNQKDEGGGMKDEEKPVHPFQVAWLSLDEGDNDPTRFLTYLVVALQTLAPDIGKGVLVALQSPQPPPMEAILTALLNDLTAVSASSAQGVSTPFILVLDDYHRIDAQDVDKALTFLLDHLPPQMHLIMATREDPPLPLARYRVRGQLTELRANDLRFTVNEAAVFLNQAMGLDLSTENIAALETRTEGWIAGLQLAALALQGQTADVTGFIKSFSGSHRFVLDYLVEEVLSQQPESVQTFLLQTSLLDRMCGSLCDALLGKDEGRMIKDEKNSDTFILHPSSFILENLEQANLFIIPLDNERRWYRYHHLFADLLRQRLQQQGETVINELHGRASVWYEENGLEIEAFQHAAAANDIDRAERLMEGKGMPLLFRGAVAPVMNWLASLPTAVLDARPSLWVTYASAFLFISQITGIEEKLQAAEAALQCVELDDETRNLIGRIASMRATVAVAQNQVETIIAQSQRALEYLHPDNLPVRISVIWNMGYAHELLGDRVAAKQAYIEALTTSQAIGHFIIHIMSALGVGGRQEAETELSQAVETYQNVLKLVGDPPLAVACAAHLGLARVYYEWNDLDSAQQHGEQSLILAQQFHSSIDRVVASEVFLARLKLAQGDVVAAMAILARANQSVRQYNFVYRLPEVTAVQIQILIQQGELAEAAQLAETHELPMSRARVYLAEGDPAKALAVLEPWQQQIEARNWADERLKVKVLQALVYDAAGDGDTAVQILNGALILAEPEGFIRTFVDEGQPMAKLLTRMKDESGRSVLSKVEGMKEYIHKLLEFFGEQDTLHPLSFIIHPSIEPLSERELEVLQLVAQGYSNREISEQLFLALNTVKGHNRRIFAKLDVQRRTEAVARARELGLV